MDRMGSVKCISAVVSRSTQLHHDTRIDLLSEDSAAVYSRREENTSSRRLLVHNRQRNAVTGWEARVSLCSSGCHGP